MVGVQLAEGVYTQRMQWVQTQGVCYIQVSWMQELLRDAVGCSLMQANAGWMQNGLLMDAAGAFDPDAGLDAGCRPPLISTTSGDLRPVPGRISFFFQPRRFYRDTFGPAASESSPPS